MGSPKISGQRCSAALALPTFLRCSVHAWAARLLGYSEIIDNQSIPEHGPNPPIFCPVFATHLLTHSGTRHSHRNFGHPGQRESGIADNLTLCRVKV